MPRARSAKRDEARDIWLQSGKTIKLKDIAAQLEVPENRVRKWKSEDKWENGTLSRKGAKGSDVKGNAPKRKPGGQPGNKNAVGNNGGAPIGNQNALKHGIFSKIYWDTLDDEERTMLQGMMYDEEKLLEEQIALLTVRERRLMKTIAQKKGTKDGLSLASVVKRTLNIDGSIVISNKQKQTETTTKVTSTFEVIQKLEEALTRVQARKTRCIQALARLRAERAKIEAEQAGSELVNDWIAGIMGGDQDG
jgi:phage terminase small subunit